MARMGSVRDRSEVRLDPAGMVPNNAENVNGVFMDRTTRIPLAPDTESRTMSADRTHAVFHPAVSYAETDMQKGGAPGIGDITSQTVDGRTVVNGVPSSPIKLTTGLGDWGATNPQPLPAHGKIVRRANPNNAIIRIGTWANEGQPANTNYESPAPWAAGTYIG
jgi:hypothetical protein